MSTFKIEKKGEWWIVRAPIGAPVSAISQHKHRAMATRTAAWLSGGKKLSDIPGLTRYQEQILTPQASPVNHDASPQESSQ